MLMADKDFCLHLAHLHNMFSLQVRGAFNCTTPT